MKFTKIVAVLAIATLATVDVASAASFGRSGGSSFSGSRSYSAPSRSYSTPSYSAPKPTPSYSAPAPTRQSSGIGGTTGSMGVRKSEVTAPVAAKVESQRAAATPSYSSPSRAPTPTTSPNSYTSPAPVYAAPAAPSGGSGFLPSFAGAMGGTLLGNALFGNNHGSGGGTTVINNGTPSAAAPAAVAGAVPAVDAAGQPIAGGWAAGAPAVAAPAKSYGIGSFIWDVLSFAFLLAVLAGLAFLGYKAYKMIRNYINRERGIAPTQPFAPTAKFWEIQNAFAAADVATLKTLLGPDLVDEATRGLEPSEINLSHISHEVALQNPREFSVHYKFLDGAEDVWVDQVWHYELHDGTWKLNGIETI